MALYNRESKLANCEAPLVVTVPPIAGSKHRIQCIFCMTKLLEIVQDCSRYLYSSWGAGVLQVLLVA